jgi:hypothetical protein
MYCLANYLIQEGYSQAVEALTPLGVSGRNPAVLLLQRAVLVVSNDPSRLAWKADDPLQQMLTDLNDEKSLTVRHAWKVLAVDLKREVLSSKAKKKDATRKPGNPENQWTKEQKQEARRYLSQWRKAKLDGKKMKQFLSEFPQHEHKAIKTKIKTAMKWESERKKRDADRR